MFRQLHCQGCIMGTFCTYGSNMSLKVAEGGCGPTKFTNQTETLNCCYPSNWHWFRIFHVKGSSTPLFWELDRTLLELTRWGRMKHIRVTAASVNWDIIGSDNGLSPGRLQAIIWTNDGILLIWPLGTKLQWNVNQNSYISIHQKF